MRKHPPEEAVAVVGSLVVMLGVNAVVRILSGESFDFTFFALWFGYGLWQGKKNSRGVVLAFSVLALLLVGLAGGFVIVREVARTWSLAFSFQASLESMEVAETGTEQIAFVSMLTLLAYIVWTLTQKDVKELFQREEPIISHPRPLFLSVILISSLLLGTLTLAEKKREAEEKQFVQDLFHYQVEVKVYDSVTGERLEGISVQGPEYNSSRNIEIRKYFPRGTTSVRHDSEGLIYNIFHGLAVDPVEIMLSAEGYEQQTLTITEETEDELRVELVRLKTGDKPKAEPSS